MLAGNSGAANIRTAAEGSVEEALAQRLLGSGIRAIRIGESGALEYSMDGENWAIPASGGGMSGNYDAGMFSSQQTLQLKRGNQAELPALKAGEPAFCTDSGRLYLGNGTENLIAGATVTAVGEIQPEAWQGENAPYTVVYTPPIRARRFCEIQPDCSALSDTQAAELLGCGIIAGESTDSGISLRAMYAKPNFRIPLELRYHD